MKWRGTFLSRPKTLRVALVESCRGVIVGQARRALLGSRREFEPLITRHVVLSSPAIYFRFFTTVLELAISPHEARHLHWEAMVTKSRLDFWRWIASRVRDYSQDPNWKHANLMGEISAACSGAFRRIGKCLICGMRFARVALFFQSLRICSHVRSSEVRGPKPACLLVYCGQKY